MRSIGLKLLFVLLVTVVSLEIGLALLDPLGLRWVHQIGFAERYYSGDLMSYTLAPGDYDMDQWSATVQDNGLRLTPDSGAGCRLTIFGDSVVFGWGVNDDETFVNRLARVWPGETVNAGQIGYNSAQIRRAVEHATFDHALYLIVRNDAELTPEPKVMTPAEQPAIYPGFGLIYTGESTLAAYGRYVSYLLSPKASTPDPQDMPRFFGDLDAIAALGVVVVGFEEPLAQAAADHREVRLIPHYDQALSVLDWHPNAASHAQIAADLQPIIETLSCDD